MQRNLLTGIIHGLDTVLKPPELDLDELCNDGTTTTTSSTSSSTSSSTTTSTTSSKSAKAAQKMRTRVHNMEEEGQGKVRSRSRR